MTEIPFVDGEVGDVGQTGDRGPTGLPGENGQPGTQGAQGEQGPSGPKELIKIIGFLQKMCIHAVLKHMNRLKTARLLKIFSRSGF